MGEEEKYLEAIQAFEQLKGYKDVDKQQVYYQARLYEKDNLLIDAVDTYNSISLFRDSSDRATKILNSDDYLAAVEAVAETKKLYTQVNNIVTYGQYEQDNDVSNGKEDIEWIVLKYDQANDRALLISKYGLEAKAYHQEGNDDAEYPTWAKSDIRAWLNNGFLNSAFTAKEQAGIRTVKVSTPSYKGYKGKVFSGGVDTQDKVWLLSRDEAETYFKTEDERKTKATAYANANGAYENDDNGCCWWWLRSPGYSSSSASSVYGDGSLDRSGVFSSSNVARPAFWLDLKSADIY